MERRHDDVVAGLLDAARRIAAGRPAADDLGRVREAVEFLEAQASLQREVVAAARGVTERGLRPGKGKALLDAATRLVDDAAPRAARTRKPATKPTRAAKPAKKRSPSKTKRR